LNPPVAINHATVRQRADMAQFLQLCAQRGIDSVSIWGDEIDKIGEARALGLLADLGLTVSGYNRIGPFDATGLARAESEMARAQRFGADHVLVFTGGLQAQERAVDAAFARAQEQIAARRVGVRLALEPLHPMLTGDRTLINSLEQANNICDQLGANIGVIIDVHHLWWDQNLAREIKRAGQAGRLYGFQVNDWLIPTRHLLTDRGMMGDGVIDLAGIYRTMRSAGFNGAIEVELFSEDWWQRPAAEVIDIAIARCREIFPWDTSS